MPIPSRRLRPPVAAALWVLAVVAPLVDALMGGRYLDDVPAILVLLIAGYAVGAWLRPLASGLAAASGAALLAWANQLVSPGAYTYANDLFFYAVVLGGVTFVGALLSGRAGQVRDLRRLTSELARQRADEVLAATLEEQNRLGLEVSERMSERVGGLLVAARGAQVDPSRTTESLALVEQSARAALDRLREAVGELRTPDPAVTDRLPEVPRHDTTAPAPRATDLVLGLSGLAVSVELVGGEHVAVPWALGLGVALGAAVTWRRTRPVVAVIGALVSMTVAALSGVPAQEPVTTLLPLSLLSYAVGAHPNGRDRLVGIAVLVAGVSLPSFLRVGDSQPGDGLVPTLVWVGLATLTGVLATQHSRRAEQERQLQEEIDRGRGHAVRLAVARQRQAVARDLHDTLAHAMTVVCLQAEVARRAGADEAVVGSALAVIEGTARAALEEMRAGLASLDSPGATLAGLAHSVRRAAAQLAVPIDLRIAGAPEDECPQAVLAERVLRESLVNISRHAPGATAQVQIDGGAHRLVVTNELISHEPSATGTGTGLVGLAETVEEAGGTLQHEQQNGRFRLEVLLPAKQRVAR